MLILIPNKPRAGIRIPANIRTAGNYSVPGNDSTDIDFTTYTAETPFNGYGDWTNNTEATGGNVVYNAQSSMRVIAAASGGGNICTGDSAGQSPPLDYLDSFAFRPGFSGNQRVVAEIYVDAGYAPTADSHEIGLLCGCVTESGAVHRWIQFNWSHDAGNRFMASFGTGAIGSYPGSPNDYDILSPTDSNALIRILQNGDIMRVDYNRSTGTFTSFLNGTQIMTITDPTYFGALNLGDGAGVTVFRRTLNGSTSASRLGFRNVQITSF